MARRWRMLTCLTALWLASSAQATAQEASADAEQLRFFETRVRPVLSERCYECHGPEQQESELRLDSLEGMLAGGRAGPAIVRGKPQSSLLLTAIGYSSSDLQMPPDEKLSDRAIADLRRWIEMGAPHPDHSAAPPPRKEPVNLEAGRQFWSFIAPVEPDLPPVQDTDWPQTGVDRFVLAELESHGLRPAKPADRRTLIRRASYDLIGLPPTPAQIDAFLADSSPDAFSKVVDRLLASPHYGERWGRHWLDVARYADSNGLDENIAHGNAWRYRDYVIASWNRDKPFDQFLVEQLAGDLLPTDDQAVRYERLIATGFLSLGPKVLAEVDEKKMEMDIVDEQIDTFGRALLGLTLGCARCHDHKFDPIRMQDYYALAGIFKSTRTMEHFTKIARWYENPIPTAADLGRQQAHQQAVTEKKQAIESLVEQATAEARAALPPGESLPDDVQSRFSQDAQERLKQLRDELAQLEKSPPEVSMAMGVTEWEVADVPIHVRGSHLTLGEVVPRGFPAVLVESQQPPLPSDQSGRLQLARWLVADGHPLTSRVAVNRLWRWHFGEGLIRSADNFGALGERPVNQPLLDWLAVQLVRHGWSIKAMHRLIMLSSTYQMSSAYDPAAAELDPQNRWHWRANVRRLEAEAIRDALLAVSGMLDLRMGGSLLHVKNREFIFNHTSKDETKYDSRKRSVYLPVVRNHLYDVFQLFDYSDASVARGSRATTTVAPQALFMLNSGLVEEASRQLAIRLLAAALADGARIEQLYTWAYGRPPTSEELHRAADFLLRVEAQVAADQQTESGGRLRAWQALCQVVLAANEFVYLR